MVQRKSSVPVRVHDRIYSYTFLSFERNIRSKTAIIRSFAVSSGIPAPKRAALNERTASGRPSLEYPIAVRANPLHGNIMNDSGIDIAATAQLFPDTPKCFFSVCLCR